MKDKKKILIINLGGIGDLLLSTPALRALKAQNPAAEINLLVFEPVKEYADGLGFIDEVFTLSAGKINFLKNLRVVLFLKNKKFDTAINMRTLGSKSGASKIKLLFKIIAPLKTIGRDTAGRGDFFDIKIPEPDIGEKFELEYDIETVKQLGVDVKDKTIKFRVDDQKRKEVNELLKECGIGEDDRIVAVHPGGKPSHRWPKENFAEVVKSIKKNTQVKFVMVAGKDEKALGQYIIRQSGVDMSDFSGRLNIYQLGALLERVDVLVCNDSGPMHIAAAIGTYLVAIFGAGYFHRYNPKNITDKVITLYKEADCAPCCKLECDDIKCLKTISVNEVYNAAIQLLKGQII